MKNKDRVIILARRVADLESQLRKSESLDSITSRLFMLDESLESVKESLESSYVMIEGVEKKVNAHIERWRQVNGRLETLEVATRDHRSVSPVPKVEDPEYCHQIQKMLDESGFRTSSFAGDEEGDKQFVRFANGLCNGIIHIEAGKINNIEIKNP